MNFFYRFVPKFSLLLLVAIGSFGVAELAHAQTVAPGTQYPSQKIVFTDPVSGLTVWRLTVDGTQNGATNNMNDMSGMEADHFSPDSNKICYAKTSHPSKPKGYYVMDINTGVETYVGAVGNGKWGNCTFSKNSNELFYMSYYAGATMAQSYSELKAVNLNTYNTRVLQKFVGGIGGNNAMSINADGTYLGMTVGVGEPGGNYLDHNVYMVVVNTTTGNFHPNWTFDTATPDNTGAGDAMYWSPVDPKVMRADRDGKLGYRNIDTLAPANRPLFIGSTGIPASHACLSVDGQVFFSSWGHPDCHPLDKGLGADTRFISERTIHDDPYIYMTQMKNVPSKDVKPTGTEWVIAVHYNYNDGGASANNIDHSHPHFSRDGRYVLWQSSVNNTSAGTPPGGADTNQYSTDLFIVLVGSSTSTPPPPATCTNKLTASTPVPTGYGASYNLFSTAKEYLVSGICSGSTATVTAGNGNLLTYVYNKGYHWTGSAWTPYTLSCSGQTVSGTWCVGSGIASIPLSTNPTSIIGYTCQWNGTKWNCGCSDSTCPQPPKWQLQQVGG